MASERPIETQILEAIVDQLLDLHPLPWKADADWLPEVVASDGVMIATSIVGRDLASAIVRYAETRHEERRAAAANCFEEADKLLESAGYPKE